MQKIFLDIMLQFFNKINIKIYVVYQSLHINYDVKCYQTNLTHDITLIIYFKIDTYVNNIFQQQYI